MRLLADLGNSRLKWALQEPGFWHTGVVAYGDQPLAAVLDRAWGTLERPERVVAACVAGRGRRRALTQWAAGRWGLAVEFAEAEAARLGVRNGYGEPASLGADRWAALLAARRLMPGAVCVVDCGTAVTVDALSAEGEFLGGLIFPGLNLLRTSLVRGTEGIHDHVGDATRPLGRSTADGVAAGTLTGLVGAVERMARDACRALGPSPAQVLMTGGDAPVLLPRWPTPAPRWLPDLVLRGLALIADETA